MPFPFFRESYEYWDAAYRVDDHNKHECRFNLVLTYIVLNPEFTFAFMGYSCSDLLAVHIYDAPRGMIHYDQDALYST
jgi:hypothetical protein